MLPLVLIIFNSGCSFGFYCKHKYPHSRLRTDLKLPLALKGIDAIIFSTFQSIGLKVTTRPVLNQEDIKAYAFDEGDMGAPSDHDSDGGKLPFRDGIFRIGDAFHMPLNTRIDSDEDRSEVLAVSHFYGTY